MFFGLPECISVARSVYRMLFNFATICTFLINGVHVYIVTNICTAGALILYQGQYNAVHSCWIRCAHV